MLLNLDTDLDDLSTRPPQGEAQRGHRSQLSSHPHQLCDGGQPARQPAAGAGGLEPQAGGDLQQAEVGLQLCLDTKAVET